MMDYVWLVKYYYDKIKIVKNGPGPIQQLVIQLFFYLVKNLNKSFDYFVLFVTYVIVMNEFCARSGEVSMGVLIFEFIVHIVGDTIFLLPLVFISSICFFFILRCNWKSIHPISPQIYSAGNHYAHGLLQRWVYNDFILLFSSPCLEKYCNNFLLLTVWYRFVILIITVFAWF